MNLLFLSIVLGTSDLLTRLVPTTLRTIQVKKISHLAILLMKTKMSETKRLLRIIQQTQVKIINESLTIIKIQANPKPKRMQTEQLPMPKRRKQTRQK